MRRANQTRCCCRVQIVAQKGTLQRIHVIVCTYGEDASTVEACVQHLLDAPLPVYAERTIYVADDGHAKPQGPLKAKFVQRMRSEGALRHFGAFEIARALNGAARRGGVVPWDAAPSSDT